MQNWKRRTRIVGLFIAGALALSNVAAAAEQSDEDLRAERDRIRSEQAVLAGKIDVQHASLEEITAALQAAEAEVRAQQTRLEDAQRDVEQAEADKAEADANAAETAAEVESLKEALAAIAVSAYVSPPQQDSLKVVLDGDIGTAPERQALLEMRVADRADVLDRFRIAQEDTTRYAQEAREAEERAIKARQDIEEILVDLEAARDVQASLAAQAQALLDQLQSQDRSLEASANSITNELDRRERQRQEEERKRREELQRQIAEANARQGQQPMPNAPSVSVVRVGGIVVNASIQAQVAAMLQAAAADGITLTGAGYRDNSVQIHLRRVNGCPDVWTASPSSCRVPTAIPGRSMHEQGLAIDFNNCSSRSTACFQWLSANAARFGFKNLPSEPWHWSTTGG